MADRFTSPYFPGEYPRKESRAGLLDSGFRPGVSVYAHVYVTCYAAILSNRRRAISPESARYQAHRHASEICEYLGYGE